MKYIELLRVTLLRWNIAPLMVVAFLCWTMWTLIDFYKTVACTIDPVTVGVIFTFLGTIGGFLVKMYGSMQTDRKKTIDGEDSE